jgi:hypothetical protein
MRIMLQTPQGRKELRDYLLGMYVPGPYDKED